MESFFDTNCGAGGIPARSASQSLILSVLCAAVQILSPQNLLKGTLRQHLAQSSSMDAETFSVVLWFPVIVALIASKILLNRKEIFFRKKAARKALTQDHGIASPTTISEDV